MKASLVGLLCLAAVSDMHVNAASCDSLCRDAGNGSGRIIGTSPACGGSCTECNGFCSIKTKADDLSDYGAGCWTGDKVCCCDTMGPPPGYRADQDQLTILNYNTYLLEVRVVGPVVKKPNMKERSEGITEWFLTLQDEEVPDVVVFTEIFSWDAETMVKNLCSQSWEKNYSNGNAKFIACESSSPFSHATLQNNAQSNLSPIKGGGVVVLTKKGHQMEHAHDESFSSCGSEDCFSKKGFWGVKMVKGTQPYWIIATHAQAYEGTSNVNIRTNQFRQMREFADNNIEDGARVVYSGDMNIFTDKYLDSDGNEVYEIETEGMLSALGAPNAPATGGTLVGKGFWLPLDEALDISADVDLNHYINNLPDEKRLGSHQFDWNVVPGPGDRLATPISKRFQMVPVKSDTCFGSDLVSGQSTDDLSDHYGVYSDICYGECPDVTPVFGKRGSRDYLPAGPACATALQVIPESVETATF